MTRISGLLESSLYVDDLETSRDWYVGVLGLSAVVEDERFAALAVGERQILLLFARRQMGEPSETPWGVIPSHHGAGELHLAFAVDAEALAGWENRFEQHRVAVESRITWPRGGTSIYVRDPDGHLVELATPGLWPTY